MVDFESFFLEIGLEVGGKRNRQTGEEMTRGCVMVLVRLGDTDRKLADVTPTGRCSHSCCLNL